ISKKWALQVINEIGTILKEELRYITPTVLSNTLNTLESNGLVLRYAFNEIPPKVEYSLTDDGRQRHMSNRGNLSGGEEYLIPSPN
ncbi:MAG TPA: helix-turn-helix domain-containing protein, partial [Nitrososphaeraceae archaeon]|nr:helix-turn-helix domain-containing protein [Nitrososphaeraceae archaeon]